MINMIKMNLKYKKINMEIYTNMMIKGIELSMITEKLKDLINKVIKLEKTRMKKFINLIKMATN